VEALPEPSRGASKAGDPGIVWATGSGLAGDRRPDGGGPAITTIEHPCGDGTEGTPVVGRAFIEVARRQLAERADRIGHCVGQLDDAQVWWRPHESMNSIANLVLHLCGNRRQWIVSGVGGEPDVRDRPGEFSERGAVPKDE